MLFYSPSKNGFFDDEVHAELPLDAVPLAVEEHESLLAQQAAGWTIKPGPGGRPKTVLEALPDMVPHQVSMRQARRALLAVHKLQAVDEAIATLPSPQREAAEIDWNYGATVERFSPFVSVLGPLIGLDDAALDELFLAAAQL
ncbi:hypothetical protein FHT32_001091 [Variovorax sp. SG517]|uniref:hypothetical protein n=1 Tax=Variovorax sp. SG517 TaxID=2587117 RepID=UPI00159D340B|nr:hypothetical protein [Variovorax sp. SG517]NVM87452.1 hypothetical protein [Variovorax sp. SG517]